MNLSGFAGIITYLVLLITVCGTVWWTSTKLAATADGDNEVLTHVRSIRVLAVIAGIVITWLFGAMIDPLGWIEYESVFDPSRSAP